MLGGRIPFRAIEAATVYNAGWAGKVWLTPGDLSDDPAFERRAVRRPTGADYSRRVLRRLGVPADAIQQLPGSTVDTAAEVRAIANQIKAAGGDRVILVTS